MTNEFEEEARILRAELEEELWIKGLRNYAAKAFGGFDPDDDMTIELAVELVEKDKRIAELEEACENAYSAIKLLPVDYLGMALDGDGEALWSFRDELLSKIKTALGHSKEIRQ